jgi:hypothetical protein
MRLNGSVADVAGEGPKVGLACRLLRGWAQEQFKKKYPRLMVEAPPIGLVLIYGPVVLTGTPGPSLPTALDSSGSFDYSGLDRATGIDTSDIDITMDIAHNVRALAPAMNRANAFATTYVIGTTAAASVAVGVAVGPSVLLSAGARATGWYLGLSGSGTGVVLGQYNAETNYVQAAKSIGANVLDSPRAYNLFNRFGEWLTVNGAFLDASIFREQQFFMSSPVLGAENNCWWELQYLMNRGIGPQQWQMVPLPY